MQVRRFINEQEVSAEELRNYTIPLTAVSVYDTIARVKKRAAVANQENNSKNNFEIKEESIAI